MESAPVLAAVIVHHGDPAAALDAVESLARWRGVRPFPVVVDNGPGPSGPLAAAVDGLGGRLIRPEANLGFGGGLNRGIEAARRLLPAAQEAFLLLNHDVLLDPDAPALLLSRLREEPALGAVGPAIGFREDPGLIWNAGSDIVWPAASPRSLFHLRSVSELPAEPYPVGFVCGCACLVRSAALAAAGGVPEEYFLYFEDAELSFRIRKTGWNVKVEPRARALHRPGSAVGNHPRLAEYCRARNRLIFSRRWAPAGPLPPLSRFTFSLSRLLQSRAAGRGVMDAWRGRTGPPPPEVWGP